LLYALFLAGPDVLKTGFSDTTRKTLRQNVLAMVRTLLGVSDKTLYPILRGQTFVTLDRQFLEARVGGPPGEVDRA
jgi:hypothetical protein